MNECNKMYIEELYTTEDETERFLKTEMCNTKTYMTKKSKVRGEGGFPRRSLFNFSVNFVDAA